MLLRRIYGMSDRVRDKINWAFVAVAWVLVILGMVIGYGAHP